jgi:hypothetical protein
MRVSVSGWWLTFTRPGLSPVSYTKLAWRTRSCDILMLNIL